MKKFVVLLVFLTGCVSDAAVTTFTEVSKAKDQLYLSKANSFTSLLESLIQVSSGERQEKFRQALEECQTMDNQYATLARQELDAILALKTYTEEEKQQVILDFVEIYTQIKGGNK